MFQSITPLMLLLISFSYLLPSSDSVLLQEIGCYTRFTSNNIDCFYQCSLVGSTLQWEFDGENVGGFTRSENGSILRNTRNSFHLTKVLLSISEQNNIQGKFDSFMIISFRKFNTVKFWNVTCLSHNTSNYSTSTGTLMPSIKTHIVQEVQLEYLKDCNSESNTISRVQLFTCGTQNVPEWFVCGRKLIYVNENPLEMAKILSDLNLTVVILPTLSDDVYNITSVLIRKSESSCYVRCSFQTNQAEILSTTEPDEVTNPPFKKNVTDFFTTTGGSKRGYFAVNSWATWIVLALLTIFTLVYLFSAIF